MPQSADLIVENASILTMDPDTPRAEAIAIRDGEIIAIAD
ncbi:MAG: amidohydrolase, partial [Mesorhizobium sp.]